MSKADVIIKKDIRNILENGTSTEGQAVRPHWPDGTPAYTVKQFGVANTYDLQEEFPAITVRKTAIKSAWDEILWIMQRQSNDIHDLSSHIWDEWADENGKIGKAYGYQVGQPFVFKQKPFPGGIEEFVLTETKKAAGLPSLKFDLSEDGKFYYMYLNQMDAVLYQLRNEPFSRRIQISLYNVKELHEMALQPCCWSVTFNVTDEKRPDGKLTLNAQLTQRSNDLIAANNWNTVQYAAFVMAVAQASGMVPGKLLHVITDQHIYDRHIEIAKELLEREEFPAPKVWLDPSITDFYKFTKDSIHVEDYKTGEQVQFEIAI